MHERVTARTVPCRHPMETVATIAGIALILLAIRDVIHELFDPENVGSIARVVILVVWKALRAAARLHRPLLYRAGPAILVTVAAVWTAMIAVGGALIYWPRLPAAFHVADGIPREATRGFGTALYLSLTTLTSVGSTDIAPTAAWLRIAFGLESLFGL